MAARPGTNHLPHRAYIEALADASEGSPAWHVIVAGYATLQLFESWMDGGMCATVPSMVDARRVRRYVETVPDLHPGRLRLAQLIEAIEAATAVEPDVEARDSQRAAVGRMLASYAKLLQFDAQWRLAADVYGTLVEFAQRTDDIPRMLDSMLMRGYSLRMQGRLDEASDAYASLRAAATAANDVRYRLEGQLADAKVAWDRGNVSLARELQDSTIAEARGAERWLIVSKGLSERARIAAMQRDYELALACSFEAFELEQDAADRERILSNIALTLSQLGLRDAARDGSLLVAATTQDHTTRLTALVNLMELGYQDGRELVFEHYRRDLARERLTPYLQAVYLDTCVEGFRAFGRSNEAHQAAQRLLDVAERYDLNEFVSRAEALVRGRAASSRPSVVAPPTQQTQSIARAIVKMRTEAGLPG